MNGETKAELDEWLRAHATRNASDIMDRVKVAYQGVRYVKTSDNKIAVERNPVKSKL